MKFREFITAFTFIILLVLLLCIVYARATWEEKPSPAPTAAVEVPSEPEQPEAPEQTEAPVYYEMYFTEDDVAAMAKMLWGEARGCTRDNQIKCAWVVCNRVDDDRFPDTIQSVLEQPSQFHGYDPENPVTEEIFENVTEVLEAWSRNEEALVYEPYATTTKYRYFSGDGRHNWYREEW